MVLRLEPPVLLQSLFFKPCRAWNCGKNSSEKELRPQSCWDSQNLPLNCINSRSEGKWFLILNRNCKTGFLILNRICKTPKPDSSVAGSLLAILLAASDL